MFRVFKYVWLGITYAPQIIKAVGAIKSAIDEVTRSNKKKEDKD